MNPRAWLFGALLVATAALGCKKLNTNRCEANGDCASNSCNPTTHYCVTATNDGTAGKGGAGKGGAGGAGGMAGSMGGAGGGKAPFQCADALCPSGTPICDMDAGACEACTTDDACKALSATTPFCAPETDGAAGPPKGTCVECRTNDDCKQSTRPICDPSTGACEGCQVQTTGDACKTRDPKTPVCVTASADGGTGPQSGSCVGCLTSGNCGGTTPFCDTTNTCVRCTTDADCGGTGPGVCMTADGHCASDAETIYVRNDTASCSDTPGAASAGTKAQPFCSMEPLLPYISKDRDLIVVGGTGQTVGGGTWSYANEAQPGELTVVGRPSAVISGGSMPAFSMTSGSVAIRGVEFALSSIGIKATGGTLALDTVKVDGCAGGIFIDGASFDIRNTTVTGNSTATDGLVSWSGIYVKSLTDAGTSQLALDTITDNANVGLLCSGPISGTGVLLSGNQGGNQMVSCGITSCAAGPNCGAQP